MTLDYTRPLEVLANEFSNIDYDEVREQMFDENESYHDACETVMESSLEGWLEIEVDDQVLTSLEADGVMSQFFDIMAMTRESEWSNP